MAELRMDPRAVAALQRGELRKDWRVVGERVQADEGRWRLVWLQADGKRGIARRIREELHAVGCPAQVVGLVGLGEAPRPWQGIAVFARVMGRLNGF